MLARLVLILLVLSGCASLDIHRAQNLTEPGLRFYRPTPYLLVSRSPGVGCTSQIVWLPDYSQEFVMVVHSGLLSSITFKPTLENGWNLTNLDSTTDRTTAANAIIGLSGVLTAALPLMLAKKAGAPEPIHPGLYHLNLATPVGQSPLTIVIADMDSCASASNELNLGSH